MQRSVATGVVLAAVLGGLVAAAPAASAEGDTRVRLGLTHLRAMLVDEAHGHVVLSSGTGLEVVSLTGAPVATVATLPEVTSLVLSADGTLVYAAVRGASAVHALDAQTFERRASYPLACPTSLAVAAGDLWASFGCDTGDGGALARLDPGTGQLVRQTLRRSWSRAPQLRSAGPTDPTLVVVDAGSVPMGQDVYRVDSGSAVAQPIAQVRCDGFATAVVSPDGATVTTACQAHPGLRTYATSSGVEGTMLATDVVPQLSLAVSHDGGFLAVDREGSPGRIEVLAATGAPALSRSFAPDTRVTIDGLRFGASGNLYAVLTVDAYAENSPHDLVVVPAAARHATSLALDGPASAPRAEQLSLAGRLVSASSPLAPGQTVAVTRTDLTGTTALPSAMTAEDGAFTVTDSPPSGGQVTYTASWAGDGSHAPATVRRVVDVPRTATRITLTTDKAGYAYGERATLTARLGPSFDSRLVSLYATPFGQGRRLVRRASADASGVLTGSFALTRRTTFTAEFAGDQRTAPTKAARTVVGRGRIGIALSGAYGSSGGYQLVHRTQSPMLTGRKAPVSSNACLIAHIQQLVVSTWRDEAANRCSRTDDAGTARTFLLGNPPAGTRFRVRWEYAGDSATPAMTSGWLLVRFTR